jgi:ribose transport system ATP-binding protein
MDGDARIVLNIEDVTKTFPGVKALDRVSFDVKAGEIHGLVGENGAGKSTLMGVASGALVPDEGAVSIDGTLVSGGPMQTRELRLAIVRQEPSLMPDLTVAENMLLGLPLDKRPPISELATWAYDRLAAWEKQDLIRADDLVAALNPEKRFIVEIAKALAADPKVLILDEPTEHLRAEDIERLFQRVREIAARGTAVVYISHRIREVRRIARRITVLRDGQCQGTFAIDSVDEQRIVELIVGGALNHDYPAKGSDLEQRPVVLDVAGLSGNGFRNVSLVLRRGEIVGLAGIDANGQREFVRAVAGLNSINDGTVRINGRAVKLGAPDRAAANGIGYLPGDRHREGILAELSVKENFAIRSISRDTAYGFISGASEAARASRAVATFAVKTPSLETPMSSLSGGNQQKLILSSVLAAKPTVLLVDEPTQGVDVGARAEIYRILRQIAMDGTAIIIVSSDAAEIAGLCDRVAVFSRGEVAQELAGSAVTENNIATSVLTSASIRNQRRREIGSFWRWAAGNSAPIVLVGLAVILLGIYASFVNEYYLTARNLGGVLGLVATLALAAYAQQIIMLIGEIDLSVGPLMGLCVVIASFFLGAKMGAGSFALGFVVIFATAFVLGVVNFLLVDKVAIHPMIATLATFMGVQAISLVLRPSPSGLIDGRLMKTIGIKIGFVPVTLIIAVVIGIGLEYILYRTTLGIAIRGLGSKREAARVVGIPPRLLQFWCYVACALFAAVAAIPMIAQVGVGDAKAGLNYTLASIAAVVIGGGSLAGGRGSFIGALLGALLLNQVNVVSTFLQLSDAWQFYLQGAMVLIGVALYSRSRQMAVAT